MKVVLIWWLLQLLGIRPVERHGSSGGRGPEIKATSHSYACAHCGRDVLCVGVGCGDTHPFSTCHSCQAKRMAKLMQGR